MILKLTGEEKITIEEVDIDGLYQYNFKYVVPKANELKNIQFFNSFGYKYFFSKVNILFINTDHSSDILDKFGDDIKNIINQFIREQHIELLLNKD